MKYTITLSNNQLYDLYIAKAFPDADAIPKRPSNGTLGGVVAAGVLVLFWVMREFYVYDLPTLEDKAGPFLFGVFAVALLRYAYMLFLERKRVLHEEVTKDMQHNEAMRDWFAQKGWLKTEGE